MSRSGWDGGSRTARWLQVLGVFVAALWIRLATVGNFVTTDEGTWLLRSVNFSDALLDGEFSEASASTGELATMPGGPTMWLGSLGRLVWAIGQTVGLVESDRAFETMAGLHVAQAMVALATSLLIALTVALVHRWAGWGAAAVAAVLLVGEPWVGALGSILHTDELTALFGMAGLLLLAVTFDVPDRCRWSRPMVGAAAGGFVLALAPLTKATGLVFGVGAALIIGFALWRDVKRRGGGDPNELASLRYKQLAAAAAGALVAVPLAWPALLADPSTQVSAFLDSVGIANETSQEDFQGDLGAGGWWFYAVALPFRVTPWFLLAVVVGGPLALIQRATRARAVWLVLWLAPGAITIAAATKQFDRYGLIVVVPLAVLAGVGLGRTLDRLLATRPPMRAVFGVAAAAVVAYAVWFAPWGLLYFNPALGGASRAEDVLLVGWGEGTERAIDLIREQEGGDCNGVTVAGTRESVFGRTLSSPLALLGETCASPPRRGSLPTYVVAYINQTQRMTDAQLDAVLAGREQVGTVEIRGITVATVWR